MLAKINQHLLAVNVTKINITASKNNKATHHQHHNQNKQQQQHEQEHEEEHEEEQEQEQEQEQQQQQQNNDRWQQCQHSLARFLGAARLQTFQRRDKRGRRTFKTVAQTPHSGRGGQAQQQEGENETRERFRVSVARRLTHCPRV